MQKDAWIIYSKVIINKKQRNGDREAVIKYAKENYNLDVDLVSSHDFFISCGNGKNQLFYQGKEIKDLPKIIVFRKYDIYLARQLELMGVKVMNTSQAMVDARNKMKTYQLLSNSGINIPKTLYIVSGVKRKYFYYKEVCEFFKSNRFIVKYVYGSKGNDVHLIDSEKKFNEVAKKYYGICIFQEYIENSFGRDLRCYVIGGKFIAAAIRKGAKGDFRSNLAQGGHPIKFDYNPKVAKLAEDAAKALNLDICGVDILWRGEDEFTVCEVNSLPGFKSLNGTTEFKGNILLLELIKDTLDNEFKL